MGRKVVIGDVVQIRPGGTEECFDFCFAIITDIKPWGVIGYVQVPNKGLASVRIVERNFTYIGKAGWTVD